MRNTHQSFLAHVERVHDVPCTADEARRIAADWHGGQASALYSFASAGHADLVGLRDEIDACLREQRAVWRIVPANLLTLSEYIAACERAVAADRVAAELWLAADGRVVTHSRYGRNTADIAPIAWAAAVALYDTPDVRDLDEIMGLAVDDHDDVAHWLRNADLSGRDVDHDAVGRLLADLCSECGADLRRCGECGADRLITGGAQ